MYWQNVRWTTRVKVDRRIQPLQGVLGLYTLRRIAFYTKHNQHISPLTMLVPSQTLIHNCSGTPPMLIHKLWLMSYQDARDVHRLCYLEHRPEIDPMLAFVSVPLPHCFHFLYTQPTPSLTILAQPWLAVSIEPRKSIYTHLLIGSHSYQLHSQNRHTKSHRMIMAYGYNVVKLL